MHSSARLPNCTNTPSDKALSFRKTHSALKRLVEVRDEEVRLLTKKELAVSSSYSISFLKILL